MNTQNHGILSSVFPHTRLRRLRKTEALRTLTREQRLSIDDLIYPIFVEENIQAPIPVETMPGVFRIPERNLDDEVRAIASDGVKAIMMFGVSHKKDPTGSDSLSQSGLMARMIRCAKKAAPEMIVISDNCFCEYTDHGHCGVVRDGYVDNDLSIKNLARQTVVAVEAGADMVAPSSMLDGQVQAIRQTLDAAGHGDIPIMAYSTKFASCFYGPFRNAAGSTLQGDRKTYQMDPSNTREAIRESLLDESEGADILMVKPALPYLDILSKLRKRSLLPIAAYQVSGEYAMIKFAAQAGAIDERRAVLETLGAIQRAGADIILTYFARSLAREGII